MFNFLEEILITGSLSNKIKEDVKENRFSSGKVCPHCKSEDVSLNGKYNNKQIYICKACRKTFADFTYSPCYNSKKGLSRRIAYIKCIIAGYSIMKCAEIVDITVPTFFQWWHKVLDTIRAYIGVGSISGVVEAVETFFRLSYKVNHSKDGNFKMPSKSYKSGPNSKSSKQEGKNKRCISRKKVSVRKYNC